MRERIPLDFIHIGLHRTGSTFLQKKIFSDVGDVKILQFNDQKTLRNEFDDLILIPPPFFDEGPIFQRIHTGFIENEYRGLSAEGLSGMNQGYFSGSQLAFICERLRTLFEPKKILIVVRSHWSYLISNYIADIRHGSTLEFPSWITRREENRELGFCKFAPLVKLYMDAFGSSRVKVIPFESMVTEDAIELFLQDFDYSLKKSERLWSTPENRSHSNVVGLNILLNKFMKTKLNSGSTVGLYDDLSVYNFSRNHLIPFVSRLLKSTSSKANEKFNCDSVVLDMFVKDTQELSDITQINFTELGYPFK